MKKYYFTEQVSNMFNSSDDFLDEKSTQKAKELIKLTKSSSTLKVQTPSDEEILRQIESLKREILEKRRTNLWEPT